MRGAWSWWQDWWGLLACYLFVLVALLAIVHSTGAALVWAFIVPMAYVLGGRMERDAQGERSKAARRKRGEFVP